MFKNILQIWGVLTGISFLINGVSVTFLFSAVQMMIFGVSLWLVTEGKSASTSE